LRGMDDGWDCLTIDRARWRALALVVFEPSGSATTLLITSTRASGGGGGGNKGNITRNILTICINYLLWVKRTSVKSFTIFYLCICKYIFLILNHRIIPRSPYGPLTMSCELLLQANSREITQR
jgi:hypothetical protein